jgi:hypothetical protein
MGSRDMDGDGNMTCNVCSRYRGNFQLESMCCITCYIEKIVQKEMAKSEEKILNELHRLMDRHLIQEHDYDDD